MDRRLLIGGVVVVLIGGMMSKQTKNRQWLVFTEYLGGPCDGETLELQVSGPDPVRAFVEHVERDDIPERLKKLNHWYSVEWPSLCEVNAGQNARAAVVAYVCDGLDV